MLDLLEWLYVYRSLVEDGERDDDAAALLENILEKMEGILAE